MHLVRSSVLRSRRQWTGLNLAVPSTLLHLGTSRSARLPSPLPDSMHVSMPPVGGTATAWHLKCVLPHRFGLGISGPLAHGVDLDLLQAAADQFRGDHDFRGLSSHGQEKPHYRCTITTSQWSSPGPQEVFFTVEGNRFLHRMVRFMVGLMVDIGRDRRPLSDVEKLLSSANNQSASPPAPPEGLYFVRARYSQLDLQDISDDEIFSRHGPPW